LFEFVAGLPQQEIVVLVFSTSGGAMKSMHIIGGFMRGHPNVKDLEKARAYAKGLLQAP
jgi:hypothetical protein